MLGKLKSSFYFTSFPIPSCKLVWIENGISPPRRRPPLTRVLTPVRPTLGGGSVDLALLPPIAETRDEEGYVVTSKGYRKKADPLDLSFLSHEAAFKSKTTWEVTRALLVFHLCTIRPLVQNSDRVNIISLPPCQFCSSCFYCL